MRVLPYSDLLYFPLYFHKQDISDIAGQAVMLVHEPSNPFDKHAIAVKQLDGTDLGYVPMTLNQLQEFQRPEDFGVIASLGPAKDTDPELYGASVSSYTGLSVRNF